MSEYHEGPFVAVRSERDNEMSKIVREDDHDFLIAYVIRDSHPEARKRDDATADLLAAAPDLLEAIEGMLIYAGRCDGGFADNEFKARARAAIAKAAPQPATT